MVVKLYWKSILSTHTCDDALQQPPFIQRTPDPLLGPNYEGYCIDLIEMIKEEVKFTYDLYEVPDGMFGTMNDRGEWNGLIGELVDGVRIFSSSAIQMSFTSTTCIVKNLIYLIVLR